MADRRWFLAVAALFLAVTLLPNLFGLAVAGDRVYTGYDLNPDDMCVYNAWMEQARRGHFLFDNRFTTEPQPRLTVHLLFYALGNVTRATGLSHPAVFHAARILFGFLFLLAAWRLVCRCGEETGTRRLMFVVLLVGAGVGWMAKGMSGATGPTDLWQPEGFVFPSLLTNALFACALWLIVEAWLAILDARDHGWATLRGFLVMLALGNIHTYDVLTIGLVGVGLAVCLFACGRMSLGWLARALAIGAGAVPPVLWLAHVARNDPVFAARAATLTFSPELWQFAAGYLPLLALGVYGLRLRKARVWAWLPVIVFLPMLLLPGRLNVPPSVTSATIFTLGYVVLVGSAAGMSRRMQAEPVMALLIVWGLLALWIPYFPGLYQRKLTMGAEIPLALLAGLGLWEALWRRRIILNLAVAVLSISNLLWLYGSVQRIASNEASTGLHPVFLTRDQWDALVWLRNNAPEDASVLDLTFYANYIPAFSGQRTYAGHWSETPDFGPKFALVNRDIYGLGGSHLPCEESMGLAESLGADYAIWHKNQNPPLTDISMLGFVVFDRPSLSVIRVSIPPP